MKHGLSAILGIGLSLYLHFSLTVMIVLGLMAGFIVALTDVVFPPARPTYLAPTQRPRPITARTQIVLAVICILIGIALITLAVWITTPKPWGKLFIGYAGGVALGVALGQLLTLSKAGDTHNSWLAAMTPQKPLDFEP